ncbi:hypothetical protein [Halalkalicoccus ordinarius]|uniref:hypothetical protein n=1 Tax=Halalkalicoccus ordinarius TaxID=3116651 RepID=UPI00300F15EC
MTVELASAFDQAVIAHLETTNLDAATWARNALGDSQSMSPTEVAREEDVVADPDDAAAIETGGAAYEAWVADIGYDPETTDTAGGELEKRQ